MTEEDRARTAMYRVESGRRSLVASSGSPEDYYRSLDTHAEIGYVDAVSIPRIAQLIQKTNQFNLATRRYTEAEIRGLTRASESLVMWLRLKDRFSDEGIVGVIILRRRSPSSWLIDTLLMSCRIIGRTVENAFLAYACGIIRGPQRSGVDRGIPAHPEERARG